MKIFNLVRHKDVSGVSGTGVVAQGVEFDSGKVVLTWLTEHSSIVVYDSIEAARAVHCHGGNSEFRDVYPENIGRGI